MAVADSNLIDVGTAVQWFKDFVDLTEDSRDTAEQCRDYKDNIQYTQEELETYEDRNQPPVTKNRIKPKIDFMLGQERVERSDPRALPRTQEDIEGALAATDALRYVMDVNNFDQERSLAFDNMITEGTGGVECSVIENNKGEKEITIRYIQWDRLWYDPHSRRLDFADAKYLGIVQWEDREDVLDSFPDSADDIESMFSSDIDETFEDAPRDRWIQGRNRVRIARVWYEKGGDWYFGTFTGAAWLEGPTKSPWIDENDETEPGLFFQSEFITRENDRYGVVWPLLSIQDAINFRESKFLHLMSVRQTWGNKVSGVDIDKVKTALSQADGHIEVQGNSKIGEDFGVLPTGDMADAQFVALQESKADIDNIGAAAALAGKGQASSGRELIARQQGGKMELGPVFDNLRQWQHRVYRWSWGRVKQFWPEEKIVRVTDDPKNAKFVTLNQPITRLDLLEEQGALEGLDEQVVARVRAHPLAQEVVGIRNNVATLGIDIIVDDAPDTTSLVGEEFEALVGLASSGVMDVPSELIIEASSFRNKDRLLEILEKEGKSGEDNQALQKQLAEMQIQLDAMEQKANIENTQADTQKKLSEAAKNGQPEQIQDADPVEQAETLAGIDNKNADTEKKQAETVRILVDVGQPAAAAG